MGEGPGVGVPGGLHHGGGGGGGVVEGEEGVARSQGAHVTHDA